VLAPLMTSAAAGVNVPFTVIAKPTAKLPLPETVPETIKPLNVSEPLFAMLPDPPDMVMVPPVGAKVLVLFTVSVPPTE